MRQANIIRRNSIDFCTNSRFESQNIKGNVSSTINRESSIDNLSTTKDKQSFLSKNNDRIFKKLNHIMKEDYLDHEQKNAMSIGLNLNDDQKMIFAKALKNAKEDVLHSPKKLSFNLGITQKPDRQVKDLINQDESQTKNNILENVAKKVLNIREETTPLKQNKTRTNKDTIIKSQTSLMNLSVKDKVQQSLNSNLEFIDVKKDPEALRQMIEESKQFYVRQFQKQMVSLVKEKKKGDQMGNIADTTESCQRRKKQ